MEDILECILGYRTLSASKARKLYHLSHTPPEYWTAKERMLSGKARTRWLREERKRASRGGNPAILDRIWPVGPYWPNGGVLVGGEKRRKEFRGEVGRMRYRDQEVSLPLSFLSPHSYQIRHIRQVRKSLPPPPAQPGKVHNHLNHPSNTTYTRQPN